jgi:hypothetical protein
MEEAVFYTMIEAINQAFAFRLCKYDIEKNDVWTLVESHMVQQSLLINDEIRRQSSSFWNGLTFSASL